MKRSLGVLAAVFAANFALGCALEAASGELPGDIGSAGSAQPGGAGTIADAPYASGAAAVLARRPGLAAPGPIGPSPASVQDEDNGGEPQPNPWVGGAQAGTAGHSDTTQSRDLLRKAR